MDDDDSGQELVAKEDDLVIASSDSSGAPDHVHLVSADGDNLSFAIEYSHGEESTGRTEEDAEAASRSMNAAELKPPGWWPGGEGWIFYERAGANAWRQYAVGLVVVVACVEAPLLALWGGNWRAAVYLWSMLALGIGMFALWRRRVSSSLAQWVYPVCVMPLIIICAALDYWSGLHLFAVQGTDTLEDHVIWAAPPLWGAAVVVHLVSIVAPLSLVPSEYFLAPAGVAVIVSPGVALPAGGVLMRALVAWPCAAAVWGAVLASLAPSPPKWAGVMGRESYMPYVGALFAVLAAVAGALMMRGLIMRLLLS